MMQEPKQDATDKTCKRAVKDAMRFARSSVFNEDAQIEMVANRALAEDATLSREVYITAYKAAQAALISKPSPWSSTTSQSQILQSMLFAEKHSERGFDAAYEYIQSRIEQAVAARPQEREPSS
jgi:hypothetical protein